MDKTYTVFNDSKGLFPTEHRITYTIRNPNHQQYRFADVSFCFDPEKKKLKRLDFLIDDKLLFINLCLGAGHSSPVWFFQKKGNYQMISDKELSSVLIVASDVLNEYNNLPSAFKQTFEVLPRQAKVYKKIFDKNITKQEKRMLLKALSEKNVIIKHVQNRYKKLVERKEVLSMGE